MSQTEEIKHKGRIVAVDTERGRVRAIIEGSSDCASCPAHKLCNHGQKDENIVEVQTSEVFLVGDSVEIVGTEIMHRKAIMLAVVLPCVIMVASMVGIFLLTFNETIAAISGLILMIVFFVALYAMRNKIEKEFVFRINKTNR